ncbi:MAG: hypothetical protein ACN2B6_00975 [Rickettsiales bacterium]
MGKIYMATMEKRINGTIRCKEVNTRPRPKGGVFHILAKGYRVVKELDVVLVDPELGRNGKAFVYSRSKGEALRILKEYKAELVPNRSAIDWRD